MPTPHGQSSPVQTLTILASENLTDGLAVTFTGFLAASGGRSAGICRRTATSGEYTIVDTLGTTKATAGQAFPANVLLQVGADAQLIQRTGSNAIVARSITASSGPGSTVEVFLIPN